MKVYAKVTGKPMIFQLKKKLLVEITEQWWHEREEVSSELKWG